WRARRRCRSRAFSDDERLVALAFELLEHGLGRRTIGEATDAHAMERVTAGYARCGGHPAAPTPCAAELHPPGARGPTSPERHRIPQRQARLHHDAAGDGIGSQAFGGELGGEIGRRRARHEDVVSISGPTRATLPRFLDLVVLIAEPGGQLLGRRLLLERTD